MEIRVFWILLADVVNLFYSLLFFMNGEFFISFQKLIEKQVHTLKIQVEWKYH